MTRKSLDHFNCSWAKTAEAIGDKWSIMIIRSAFFGVTTFSEFLDELAISKNILAQRLDHLITHGVLRRVPSRPGGTRLVYRLTDKGRDLFPAIVALGQWGDKWIFGEGNEPVIVVDRANEQPVLPMEVKAKDGRPLMLREAGYVAGPGATEETRAMAGRTSQIAHS